MTNVDETQNGGQNGAQTELPKSTSTVKKVLVLKIEI